MQGRVTASPRFLGAGDLKRKRNRPSTSIATACALDAHAFEFRFRDHSRARRLAAIGGLFIDAVGEAALAVFLFAVGEVLEGIAAGATRDGIRALSNLVPKTGMLEVDGTTKEVPAASLSVCQMILVRPGDRIPADGQIYEGTSSVHESPVTGESLPKTRGAGDSVFAGQSTPKPPDGSK